MHISAIPDWNASGVLPPYIDVPTISDLRLSYHASLTDVILRFGTSPDRLRILDGLLKFRADLHGAGLTEGFQWINGSFTEEIEIVERRSPNDIDIVTFFKEPVGISQTDLVARAPLALSFDPGLRDERKKTYFVDSMLTSLTSPAPSLVERSCYWYGLWSHRRNDLWKGYVQVELASTFDHAARNMLDTLIAK